jgi:type IV pilus assembly protein PilQ
MFQLRNLVLVAVLLSCVLSVGHALEPVSARTGQLQRARTVMDRSGVSIAEPSLESANLLLDVALPETGEADLVLRSSGEAAYKTFVLDQGRRFVLDLNDTIDLNAGKSYTPADTAILSKVRTGLHTVQPALVSRLVLDLNEACTFEVRRMDSKVRIVLHPIAPDLSDQELRIDLLQACSRKAEMPVLAKAPAANLPEEALSSLAVALKNATEEPELTPMPAMDSLGVALDDFERSLASVVPTGANGIAISFQPASPSEALWAANFAIELARIEREIRATMPPSAEEVQELQLSRLTGSLEAVAAATVEIPGFSAMSSAAVEEPPEEAPAEAPDAEGTKTVEAEDAPEEELPPPPPPREAPPSPDTLRETQTDLQVELRKLEQAEEQETAEAPVVAPRPKWTGDPLMQPVDLDFVEMELKNVVAMLAFKAGINVIADTELDGTVTVKFRNVPLKRAMEAVLRMGGKGIVEEKGIYRFVPYEEAMRSERTTRSILLENAKAADLRKLVEDLLAGSPDATLVSVADNEAANLLVIAGPEETVEKMAALVEELDVADPVLPTVTEAIKLNNSDPSEMMPVIQSMLTPEIGQAQADIRARHLIVTDLPIVVEQVRALVQELDVPVKQVTIDTMLVDAAMDDSADTGVDWLLSSLRRQSTRSEIMGGRAVGNLQQADLSSNLSVGDVAGLLNFGLLSDNFDWRGVIQAEVRNNNAKLVSNPILVASENEEAKITIAREIPYVELTQSEGGGQQTSTAFKTVGTVLTVTPSVSHDNHISAKLVAKESGTQGEFGGVPIENLREISTTLRMASGQTIFIGGLRKNDGDTTVRKVPVLGDVPVLNVLFRSQTRSMATNELLVFLTCEVQEEDVLLTPYQQEKLDEGTNAELKPSLQGDIAHDISHPGAMRDPAWKWRRAD